MSEELNPPGPKYVSFLQLSYKVESHFGLKGFGLNEKALFQEVFLAWFKGASLSVNEAIAISHLGSPATLHKRLALLRDLKLVDAVHLNEDHRSKFLQPTDTGLKYIERLAHCFAQAAAT